jgi:DNA-binding CsgD family transcriptional regulator
LTDPKNFNFYNELSSAKAGMSSFVLFNEKQWAYIQNRYELTVRERQIMELVCKGYRNEEIAKKIDIALGTVKTHIRNIHRKTQTRSKIATLLRFLYDVNTFFGKQSPTRPVPIVEIQKPSNIDSSKMGETKQKDQ